MKQLLLIFLLVLPIVCLSSVSGFKVVCYYETWVAYRKSPGNMAIEQIPTDGCTHLIYSFADLDVEGNNLKPFDPNLDIFKNGYDRFTALKKKNPSLKTLLAVGGWNMGVSKFQQIASNQAKRDSFAQNSVNYLLKYGFDGLDLDWEYPGDTERGGRGEDKKNMLLLIESLSQQFKSNNLMLTIATPALKSKMNNGYDPSIFQFLDQVHLMAYDLHGSWENTVDVHSPLHRRDFDAGVNQQLNVQDSAQVWVDHGCPKEKLIIGIPTYGRSFTLKDSYQTGLKSPSVGAGTAGELTGEAGMLSYVEICRRLKQGWTREVDPKGQVPFASKGKQWVGYEDADSIAEKSKFIDSNGYGGGMFWAIDLDDWSGDCSSQKFPLLNALMGGDAPPHPIPDPTESPHTDRTELPHSDPTESSSSSPSPTDRPTTSSGSGSSPGDACVNEGSFSQYQPDCGQYLWCVHGQEMLMSCPSGLYWNQPVLTCDWPENVTSDCVRN